MILSWINKGPRPENALSLSMLWLTAVQPVSVFMSIDPEQKNEI
jgi:hypothetical protein